MRGRSVFSGVGGLDLGAELAGVPIEAQCEPVEYRQRILAARFRSVIYPDIRQLESGVFTDPRGGGRAVYDPEFGWSDGEAGAGDGGHDATVEREPRDGLGELPRDGEGIDVEGAAREERRGDRPGGDADPGAADLLVGGFPCQDLSVAGKRKGLGGGRSGLYWEIVRLLRSAGPVRPRYVLLENVPGLLSSCSCRGCRKCGALLRWHQRRGCPGAPVGYGNDGARADRRAEDEGWKCAGCEAAKDIRKRHAGTDFAVVCAALANLGYRVSYRILDSRYFGVAQRRRRVFMFAELDFGAGRRSEVLLEPEGGVGDPLACGSPWEGAAAAFARGARERGDGGHDVVGGVHGYGVGGPGDDDLSAPLGTFGKTGGHRQDLDSAGAYVVNEVTAAGPEGEDLSHAIGAANPNRHDPTFQTYVSEVSPTLREHVRNNSNPTVESEMHVVEVPVEAATLTKGSASEGVSEPGRRAEDDHNLVAYSVTPGEEPGSAQARETDMADTLTASDDKRSGSGTLAVTPGPDEEPHTFDWQAGGGGNDKSFKGKSRTWIDDKPGEPARALSANKTLAVHVPAVEDASAFQQTPQGDVNEDDVAPPVLGRGGSVGHNSPMVYDPTSSGEHPVSPPLKSGGRSEDGSKGIGADNIPVVAFQVAGNDFSTGEDESPTLRAGADRQNTTPMVYQENADGKVYESEDAPTLRGTDAHEGGGAKLVVDGEAQAFESRVARNGRGAPEDVVPPLKAESGSTGKGDGAPMVFTTPEVEATAVSENQRREVRESDHAPALGTPLGHPGQGLPMVFTKTHGSQDAVDDPELWGEADVARSRNSLAHATEVVVEEGAVASPLEASDGHHGYSSPRGDGADNLIASRPAGAAVRRLSPTECERLQGFPDGHTLLPCSSCEAGVLVEQDERGAWRHEGVKCERLNTPDGPRYAALGDAVTVPVPFWVVSRLLRREALGL